MDKFYGFDLGDAESALTKLRNGEQETPQVLSVAQARNFVTAFAVRRDGAVIIGESACYEPDVSCRRLRFKSRFLKEEDHSDLKSFAAGVLGELYLSGELVRGDDQCFYIGCPAGWDKAAREAYRSIFESVGYPPLKIVSESRAAMVSACQSRHLQVGYDILSRPVLVVDIGSSTTDFAYIMGGKEVDLKTGGEVSLGGGIMDEILLEESTADAADPEKLRRIFAESEEWRTYCEFAARRLKEKYFSDEAYWRENVCVQSVQIRAGLRPVKLRLVMDKERADRLLHKQTPRLAGRSFCEVFMDSLRTVKQNIREKAPELIFLTGGVSRLPVIRKWCQEIFPEAVVICGNEPQFSVANGLAWCGRIDEQLRRFKADVDTLIESTAVEDIVQAHIGSLYRATVDALVEPILDQVAIPVMDRWRAGEIDRLSEIDVIMEREIDGWLHSQEGRQLLGRTVGKWLGSVSASLEEHTVPICIRHNVPYAALSLNAYLSLSDLDIRVDTRDLFAVEEITWLIDTIVSIVVGLLCGGSGIALISSGIQGILVGVVVSVMILALGKEKMQDAFLQIRLPRAMRKLVPKSYFRSRTDRISTDVKESLYQKLEKEKNEEITDRLVAEISQQIESCLIRMAQVVEIPLG